MTVINAWAAASTTTITVTAVTSGASTVRLAVADNSGMSSPTLTSGVSPDGNGAVKITASGLDAGTRYWWALDLDGELDEAVGTVLTMPAVGEPADITFWAATCAGQATDYPVSGALVESRTSDHPVHSLLANRMTSEDILFGWHGGDRSYPDIGSGQHGLSGTPTLDMYRDMFDGNLLSPRQQAMHRSGTILYSYDDHDGGPNDHDRTYAGIALAQEAYREKVPHPSLPSDVGSYWSVAAGRVLFIAADVRTVRDPNTDTDGPGKTMLGNEQKAWMQQLLANTDAQFLVWLMPDRWRWSTGTGINDSWSHFAHERDEMVQMFGDLGWLGRMLIVCGDAHNLGIDTGTEPGRPIPMVQAAPLDATPSSALPSVFDHTAVGGVRGSYATVRINDLGSRIDVTVTGWTMSNVQGSHTFSVDADDPTPPPPPAPEPVARGEARTRVTWLGCDLVSGRIIAELPEITGTVSRVLGEPTSASLQMPIPLGGPGAVPVLTVAQATEPGRTMVVAVVNAVPMWGGIVLTRKGGTEATLELGCASLEAYLDRRYVRDHSWTLADEASTIAAGLIGDAQTEGIGLTLDAPPTGRLRTRSYLDQDDATVLSRLQELADVIDGPEWTIDLDWTDKTQTAVAKIVRVRSRIGRDATEAVFETRAHSVFDARGAAEARYTFAEDYADGRGANHVVATSSGEGEDRPQSAPARDEVLLAAGWPRWERRWSPSSSITTQSVLDEHAAAELARRRRGARVWTLEARWDAYPRLGVDWALGDDIAWRVVGHRHPDGVSGQARVIGWDLDMQASVVRPKLLEVD